MSMLTVQYRMHERIMDWSSKELYNSKVLRACVRTSNNRVLELISFLKEKKMIRFDCVIGLYGLISLQIKAHSSVAGHMLLDLEDVKGTSSTEPTLLLIDTAGYAVYCCHIL